MTSNDKKANTEPAPKSDAPPKDKGIEETAQADGGRKEADTSAGYSRGEGQKPVSNAYKDNWNLIFGRRKNGESRWQR